MSRAYKQSECMLLLLILLTRADGGFLAEDVRKQIFMLHPYKQSECMLPFPTLLTSANTRTPADGVLQQSIASHP